MPTYILGAHTMMLLTNEGDLTIIPVVYEASDVDETSFEAQFGPADISFGIPDISQYSERVVFTLNEQNMSFPAIPGLPDGRERFGWPWPAALHTIVFQLTPVDAFDLEQVRSINFQNLDLTVPAALGLRQYAVSQGRPV